jgi:hypothetical protein
VAKLKKAKIFTPKLNLKVQSIYIKPLLKNLKYQDKPCFKMLIKIKLFLMLQQNAQNVVICLGYFSFLKYYNEPKK